MEVKTYTTIFDKAKAAYGTGAYDDATLEFLFPDLKVSEDERMVRALISGFENWKSNGNLTFNLTDVDDILAYLEKQKEQKPADGKELLYVSSKSYNIGYRDGKREAEQKTAEWSEEDEKMRVLAFRIVNGFKNGLRFVGEENNKEAEKVVSWLKSLRPSWKPSEVHLSALLAIISDPNNIGSQTCQLALTDLYEQLKKL